MITLSEGKILSKNSQIESLLHSISSGDKSAVGDLYELIKTDVYAFALAKTCSKYDTDDVMQDTFVNIFKYAKCYVPKGKPMAWIFRIELNLIRRRFQLKNKTVMLDESHQNTPSSLNVEQKVIDNLFLRELLKKLSEEEREVITLHVVSGLKHREIANLIDKPLSTVLSKYNRAIKKLQLIIKEI